MAEEIQTKVCVIGGGPGGYPAAFHAADLGMDVVLVDLEENPGGVCLYRGCIPSKAILHAAEVLRLARESADMGITFGEPTIDLERLRTWTRGVVAKLTGGLGHLTRQRGIRFVRGRASFADSNRVLVETPTGDTVSVRYETAILATGSKPARPRLFPESPRIMDSTTALALEDLPQRLLVVGGGYIGLELGQAYAALGTRVTTVEMQPSLLPGVEPSLVRVLAKTIEKEFEAVLTDTRVTQVEDGDDGVSVTMEKRGGDVVTERFDKLLVAVGRAPATAGLGLENTAITVGPDGFVTVDAQRRTTDPAIYAVGDIAGQPLLAHKATHEGRAAVEALNDGKTVYSPLAIPAVVFTDPEIAWCGLTEQDARRQGLSVRVGRFPWAASGRAATLNRSDGLTTVVADEETGRVCGIGIVGPGAGELIGEGVLAIEMGAVAEDLALTIHAHPSLSETVMEAAEAAMGVSTHFFERNLREK